MTGTVTVELFEGEAVEEIIEQDPNFSSNNPSCKIKLREETAVRNRVLAQRAEAIMSMTEQWRVGPLPPWKEA